MTRHELEEMDRDQLVAWLEGARSTACYDEESTDDFDRCGEEEGFAS